MQKKIMLAFGTRPEAIKMAPLIHELKKYPNEFNISVVVTAQHREMLDQVLEIFEINADLDLNVMKKNQDLFDVTSRVLVSMRDVLKSFNPDLLLVHGDTTTTFGSSLAAFYLNIKVGHVEAGLRTFDLKKPFPEEFNRQITSKIADLHFAPTETSKKNLLNDGIDSSKVFITGNTVIDSLYWIIDSIEKNKDEKDFLSSFFNNTLNFDWEHDKFILITGHRRENFGDGFLEICNAIKKLSQKYKDIHFVYPVHLNPNVIEPVTSILSNQPNVHLINPLSYKPFIFILKKCYIVLTDSGGIQEEAPSLGKPVLVMRETTERPEAVAHGTVELVGANMSNIIQSVSSLIEDKNKYELMAKSKNPYGDGLASVQIVNQIRKELK